MLRKNIILLGIAGLFLGVFHIGQGTGSSQTTDKKLTMVSISQNQSQPGSGKQMYKDYCAACHGMDGTGNGPAVSFLKTPPPNLATMATRYNEKSVVLNVDAVLRFKTESKAHGTLDMPVWGQMFKSLEGQNGHSQLVEMRIHNLSVYVQSLQKN